MLDQIEQLFHGIRDVSNAIAHDLRTPLAELRSRLEELSLTRPSADETFAEIDAAVADVDRVIRIFNALLRLAEIDTGMRRSGFVSVNAAELAAQAVELYVPAAELKGISLSCRDTGPIPVSGDPLLLAQAVSNLIDNALKYASDGGKVTVEVLRGAQGAIEIAVADDGPGISDSEKIKAPERFYRGDTSRGTPGVGLGPESRGGGREAAWRGAGAGGQSPGAARADGDRAQCGAALAAGQSDRTRRCASSGRWPRARERRYFRRHQKRAALPLGPGRHRRIVAPRRLGRCRRVPRAVRVPARRRARRASLAASATRQSTWMMRAGPIVDTRASCSPGRKLPSRMRSGLVASAAAPRQRGLQSSHRSEASSVRRIRRAQYIEQRFFDEVLAEGSMP